MKKIQFFVDALMLLAAKNVMTIDYLHAEVLKKIERDPLNRETTPDAVQKLMNKIRKGRIVTTIYMSDLNGYCLDGEHRRAALL
jgi:ParB-like chromosome segregation protein Spo0J